MLNVTISLLFAATLVGSLAAIAIMLSSNGARILSALAGDGGIAPSIGDGIAAPRYAAVRPRGVRPAAPAVRPVLRAAA